jgi:hypothetical protein
MLRSRRGRALPTQVELRSPRDYNEKSRVGLLGIHKLSRYLRKIQSNAGKWDADSCNHEWRHLPTTNGSWQEIPYQGHALSFTLQWNGLSSLVYLDRARRRSLVQVFVFS